MDRRLVLALGSAGVLGLGALGYAGQSGRLDLFTPQLPADPDLPGIDGLGAAAVPGLSGAGFQQDACLLNVWASWCPECRSEHAVLMALSQRPGLRLFGLAADDTAANVAAYLARAGNPFSRLSLDLDRRYQRALKHRGIPQTYVFAANGTMVERITGVITAEGVENRLLPALERARRA